MSDRLPAWEAHDVAGNISACIPCWHPGGHSTCMRVGASLMGPLAAEECNQGFFNAWRVIIAVEEAVFVQLMSYATGAQFLDPSFSVLAVATAIGAVVFRAGTRTMSQPGGGWALPLPLRMPYESFRTAPERSMSQYYPQSVGPDDL